MAAASEEEPGNAKKAKADAVYTRGLDAFSPPHVATTIEAAVYALRAAIMQGKLRPGQKLVEADLCRSLDVSRASMREALRALEAEKLVELVHNRGPSVARLGKDEVEAIHEVWAMLTGEAVACFAAKATVRDRAAIRTALTSLEDGIAKKSPLTQLAATNSFFMTVMKRCGNSILTEVVISLVSRVNFLRAQALLHSRWGMRYAEELREIVDAVDAHDVAWARRATAKHIASVCSAAKQVIARTDDQFEKLRTTKPPTKAASVPPRRAAKVAA